MKSLQHRVSYEQTSCTKPYKKNLFVNLMFVMRFDKNKRSAGTFGFLVYIDLLHCDQVQNTAELCSLLQTVICP